jgi:hypothetical protein
MPCSPTTGRRSPPSSSSPASPEIRQVEQGLSIPILPALIWRLAGRVPTPIGRLTDKRDLDAKVWDREKE